MSKKYTALYRKIERAKHHISELNSSIAEYYETDWYEVDFSSDPISGNYALTVKFKGSPHYFSEIVGDVVHNLRAALDLTVVEAVELSGGNTKNVCFPFCHSAKDLPGMIKTRNVHWAEQDYVSEIVQLKPYHGGDEVLRALHDLDIMDKHRTLIPSSNLITTPEIGPKMEDDGETPCGFSTGNLELELKPNSPPKIDFIFPENFPMAGESIVRTLQNMTEKVAIIVSSFENISLR